MTFGESQDKDLREGMNKCLVGRVLEVELTKLGLEQFFVWQLCLVFSDQRWRQGAVPPEHTPGCRFSSEDLPHSRTRFWAFVNRQRRIHSIPAVAKAGYC